MSLFFQLNYDVYMLNRKKNEVEEALCSAFKIYICRKNAVDAHKDYHSHVNYVHSRDQVGSQR